MFSTRTDTFSAATATCSFYSLPARHHDGGSERMGRLTAAISSSLAFPRLRGVFPSSSSSPSSPLRLRYWQSWNCLAGCPVCPARAFLPATSRQSRQGASIGASRALAAFTTTVIHGGPPGATGGPAKGRTHTWRWRHVTRGGRREAAGSHRQRRLQVLFPAHSPFQKWRHTKPAAGKTLPGKAARVFHSID